MFIYWPKSDYLSWSDKYATITYDPPENPAKYKGIKLPKEGPSSCIWIIPGTHDV